MARNKTKEKQQPTGDAPIASDHAADAAEPALSNDGNATPDPIDAAVADDADSVEALRAKIEALQDSLLRAKAECQNIQRRAATERVEAITYGNTQLMQSLVSVLDDFDRSLETGDDSADPKTMMEGVRLIHANLVKALQDHGLTTIPALHQPFDPHVHQAMLQQPSADHPPETVLQVIAKGYKLRERVIRPVKVIVAKAVESAAVDSANDQPPNTGEPSDTDKPAS